MLWKHLCMESSFLSPFRLSLSLNKILKVALGHCSCVRMWAILQLGEMFSLLGWFYRKKSFLIKQSF